jgi:hypothetical protein
MRLKKDYKIPIPSTVQNALDIVNLGLTTQQPVDLLQKLHIVFKQLWMHTWLSTAGNALLCPTIRTLALLSYKADGGFTEPFLVSPIIAKFQLSKSTV